MQLYEGQAAFSGWAVSLETMEAAGLPTVDSFLYAPLAPDADLVAVRAELDTIQAAYPTVRIQDQTEFKESISGQINQLLSLVYALLGLSVIIAIFGVINTLALSIIERTREIGMLRAVGMLRKQVRTMIRWESIVISFFGAFTGVALGLLLGVALQRLLVNDGITELAIPWTLIVVVLVATAIVGVLAAVWPAGAQPTSTCSWRSGRSSSRSGDAPWGTWAPGSDGDRTGTGDDRSDRGGPLARGPSVRSGHPPPVWPCCSRLPPAVAGECRPTPGTATGGRTTCRARRAWRASPRTPSRARSPSRAPRPCAAWRAGPPRRARSAARLPCDRYISCSMVGSSPCMCHSARA